MGDSDSVRVERPPKVRTGVRSSPPLAFVIAVAIVIASVGIGQMGCTACRSAPSPTERQAAALQRVEQFKRSEALKQAGNASIGSTGAGPHCPGSLVTSSIPQGLGGHKVTLSWNPSAPGDSRYGTAVGYCIYRGIKHKDPSPQLLNSTPFAGTTCVDDLVVNDQKYYYVVRAISLQGSTSDTSNEVPAVIPTGSQSRVTLPASSVPASSAPLCRQLSAAK